MKASVTWTMTLLILALGVQTTCLAAESGRSAGPGAVLGALAGTAVPTAELGSQHARGILIGSALSEGAVTGNSVGRGSVTGTITNNNSINNNVGITTVLQNTGNNSLIQSSTSILITIH